MYMADPSALARTSLTRKIQLSVWYGRMLSGTETVRVDASEVRVSSSVAQSLPVISTTPVVHEAVLSFVKKSLSCASVGAPPSRVGCVPYRFWLKVPRMPPTLS